MRHADTNLFTYCDGLATCSLGVDICEAVHASLEFQVIGSLQWAWQQRRSGLRRLEGQNKLFFSRCMF